MPSIEFFCPNCNRQIEKVIEDTEEKWRYDWEIENNKVDFNDSTICESKTLYFMCPECEYTSLNFADFLKVNPLIKDTKETKELIYRIMKTVYGSDYNGDNIQ